MRLRFFRSKFFISIIFLLFVSGCTKQINPLNFKLNDLDAYKKFIVKLNNKSSFQDISTLESIKQITLISSELNIYRLATDDKFDLKSFESKYKPEYIVEDRKIDLFSEPKVTDNNMVNLQAENKFFFQ